MNRVANLGLKVVRLSPQFGLKAKQSEVLQTDLQTDDVSRDCKTSFNFSFPGWTIKLMLSLSLPFKRRRYTGESRIMINSLPNLFEGQEIMFEGQEILPFKHPTKL